MILYCFIHPRCLRQYLDLTQIPLKRKKYVYCQKKVTNYLRVSSLCLSTTNIKNPAGFQKNAIHLERIDCTTLPLVDIFNVLTCSTRGHVLRMFSGNTHTHNSKYFISWRTTVLVYFVNTTRNIT